MGPPDPDRFHDFRAPGSHEWWYFDAIGDDGRDALVVVWYAGLPFDPAYRRAVDRHLRRPDRHPSPDPLDHCAIGISWYRWDPSFRRRVPWNPGPLAQGYALNAHRRGAFEHVGEPWSVRVAESRVERDASGYRLRVEAPDVDGRHRVRADLRFEPAADTAPFERDFGSPGPPHVWMLAAADCRVSGTLAVDGPDGLAIDFEGRGYHDHNAGSGDMAASLRRWEWGRVHHGDLTDVFYEAEPRGGTAGTLRIRLRHGRPELVREPIEALSAGRRRNPFGLTFDHGRCYLDADDLRGFARWNDRPIDSGPFYQRWLADFERLEADGPPVPGITEVLDGDRLRHPLWSRLVGFRLRRP